MRQRLSVLVVCLTVVLVGYVSPALADSSTPLPFVLSGTVVRNSWIAVDPVGEHVFVTGGAGNSSVVVLNFKGEIVKTISGEQGASQMALDPSTHTLYVALHDANAISEIDTSTLTERTRFSTDPFDAPSSLVMAGGELWFSCLQGAYTCAASVNLGGTGLVNEPLLGIGCVTEFPGTALAAGGTSDEFLALGDMSCAPPRIAVYDVSQTPPTLVSSLFTDGGSVNEYAFDPTGNTLYFASGSSNFWAFPTSTLQPGTSYSVDNPVSVTTSPDGSLVAVGAAPNEGPNLFLFPTGSTTPENTLQIGGPSTEVGPDLTDHALAFSPDGSKLFAVAYNGATLQPEFEVTDAPTVRRSETTTSLHVSAVTVRYGSQVSLTAQVTGTSAGTVELYSTVDGTTSLVASQAISNGTANFTPTPAKDTTYSAVLEGGSGYTWSTSSSVPIGVKPEVAIADHVQRTNVLQLLTRGEKIDIVAQINPEIQSPLEFKVQGKVHHRWHTVASVEATLKGGLAGVQFKTRIPGSYRAIALFADNTDYSGASSKWVHFKAPTHLG